MKNVAVAGRCRFVTVGRRIELVNPQLLIDPKRRLVPLPIRPLLGLLRVSEFLRMTQRTGDREPPGGRAGRAAPNGIPPDVFPMVP